MTLSDSEIEEWKSSANSCKVEGCDCYETLWNFKIRTLAEELLSSRRELKEKTHLLRQVKTGWFLFKDFPRELLYSISKSVGDEE